MPCDKILLFDGRFFTALGVSGDMAIGDVFTVDGCSELHYVDTGMYDTAEYGAVYILDADRPALVDTGIGTRYEAILDALAEVGIAREDLEYILPTHVHLDHAGGAGYLAEYDAERFFRDARIYRIYEGTTQILQLQIAKRMLREYAAQV